MKNMIESLYDFFTGSTEYESSDVPYPKKKNSVFGFIALFIFCWVMLHLFSNL